MYIRYMYMQIITVYFMTLYLYIVTSTCLLVVCLLFGCLFSCYKGKSYSWSDFIEIWQKMLVDDPLNDEDLSTWRSYFTKRWSYMVMCSILYGKYLLTDRHTFFGTLHETKNIGLATIFNYDISVSKTANKIYR